MKQTQEYTGPNKEWLSRMAEYEDACPSIAVGGMAVDLGLMPAAASRMQRTFGRFIEFARRRKGLSVEQLAEMADVDLAEIVDIEAQEYPEPKVRTIYQLAQVLNVPANVLLEVAGLTTPRTSVSKASLQFAARSEPTTQLSNNEREAFEEFVKVLTEQSDGD